MARPLFSLSLGREKKGFGLVRIPHLSRDYPTNWLTKETSFSISSDRVNQLPLCTAKSMNDSEL